jgi:hypothetical protein
MLLGYIGIDQHGYIYNIKKYPRKELLDQLGSTHASIMYCDLKSGGSRRKGYVISGHWVEVYEVHNVVKWG